jgi:hypothetical protein
MDSPRLINYFEDIDIAAFFRDKRLSDELKAEAMKEAEVIVKHFKERKRYIKKDPRNSPWFLDYVLDSNKTFSDEGHRDGKFFRRRFCHSLESVLSIVRKITEKEHRFWRVKTSPEGNGTRHSISLRKLSNISNISIQG